jgi:GH18 family chitinase/lysophospholipase L1-like esterase
MCTSQICAGSEVKRFFIILLFCHLGILSCAFSQEQVIRVNFGLVKSIRIINDTTIHYIPQYQIIVSTGANGITDSNGTALAIGTDTLMADSGRTIIFHFAANAHYNKSITLDGVNQGQIDSLVLAVNGRHSITASYPIMTFTIYVTVGTGGIVSPAGNTTVNYGSSQTFAITPSTGYQITQIIADGVSKTVASSYTFTNITAPHTLIIMFSPLTYTITASAGSGGSVAPSGATIMNYGTSITYSITPSTGYVINTLTVDGVNQSNPGASYTFNNVTANHTIAATFRILTYTITASIASGSGTITPAGVTTVNYGGSQAYTITPATNYVITSVLVDGVSQGAISSYTFMGITSNRTIAVNFTYIPPVVNYTITASAGTGGTVTPSGATTVTSGSSQAYTIAPSTGYNLTSVLVDGVGQGAVTSYTFTNVTANHTISATFTIKTYTITVTSSVGGTVSPGTTTVNHGSSQAFTITPLAAYNIDSVKVDGVKQGIITSYTFTNVTAAHTLTVWFSVKTFAIVASSDLNGTILPSGTTIAIYGTSQVYTFTPNTGYTTNAIVVDGVTQAITSTYTFSNIQAGHVISVSFRKSVTSASKIMLAGNSITNTTCYPPYLFEDIQAGGYTDVSFVGTMTMNAGQGVTCSGVQYYGTPLNEGHSGYSSSNFASGFSGWLSALGSEYPDIFVLHLGTNDYWNGGTSSDIHSTLLNYTSIITTLRAVNPTVNIIVCKLIPADYSTTMSNAITLLNDSIPNWTTRTNTIASPVTVVDLNTGFDHTWIAGDASKVHPNAAGAKWMADRIYAALVTILGSHETPDVTKPIVSITTPTSGSTISNIVTINATATDNVGVIGVLFQIDGSNIGVEQTIPNGSTYSVSLNTGSYSNGTHTITAKARDAAGNDSTKSITVNISNVIQPPATGVIAYDNFNRTDANPLTGYHWSTLLGQTSGSTMRLYSNAIQAYSAAGATGDGGGITWDSLFSKGSGASLTLTATNGNFSYSSLYIYTKMAGKTLTSGNGYRLRYVYPSSFMIERVIGGTTIAATLATASYNIQLGDTIKFYVQNDITGTMAAYVNSTQIMASADTTYKPSTFYYWVRGMVTPTLPRFDNWTMYNTVPSIPPATPLLTYPVNKDTGIVRNPTFTWTESVSGSTFRLQVSTSAAFGTTVVDDSTLGAMSYPSPQLNLATTYYWRVRAKNTVGYSSYSTIDTFKTTSIVPDTITPTVAITYPANGDSVLGTITITATATDNIGVVGVQFKVDGSNLNAEDLTSPYSTSWNTTTFNNGSHSLSATARDAAGNTKTLAITVYAKNPVIPPSGKWITAYYAGWTQDAMPADSINYTAYTHVCYFSGEVSSNGSINWSGNGASYGTNVQHLVTKAHAAGTKVLITVGGWSTESAFNSACSNATTRATFINNWMNYIRQANMDGADVDWEPLSSGDQTAYLALAHDLRDSLTAYKSGMVLTMATQWGASVSNAAQSYFDQINLMTYDLAGLWSGWVTWHNSAIYDNNEVPGQEISANALVNAWHTAGVPLAKLGIGNDWYGYKYSGVTGPRQSISGGSLVQGNRPFSDIMKSDYQPSYVRWDTAAQAAYLTYSGGWVTYDNEQTIQAKIKYLTDKGIGGMIIWELGADYQHKLQNAVKLYGGGH